MYRIFVAFSLLALAFAGAFAQSSSNAFDVASIKPSDPNIMGTWFRNSPGMITINGATAKILIQQAYDVHEFQITGGPSWVNSERYDVTAKVEKSETAPSDPQNPADREKAAEAQRERMRALLADRFQLKIHRETKELQSYVLTIAKGGPKLKESSPDNQTQNPDGDKNPTARRGNFIRMGRGQVMGQSIPISLLVRSLSQQLGRPVTDNTGLTGSYDFTLEWTPDAGQSVGPGFGGPGGPPPINAPPRLDNPAPAQTDGPSLFAALEEQLGLKLESRKAPAEIIVIDSIEKPSEN